jgi:predicted transcriptional regulator
MTKLMEMIIDRLRQLPESNQDQVANGVAELLEEFPAPDEVEAIAEGRAAYERGEFSTPDDVEHDMELGAR